jgi:hypothetical protein
VDRRLDIGATVAEAFSLYREQAGVLMPLAFWLFLVVAISNGLTEGDLSLSWISQILGFTVGALYEGIVVCLVRDLRDGRRDSSVRDLTRTVLPMMGPLVGEGVLYGLGVFFGTLLLIVPGLYLATVWAVAAPVIVIERLGVFDALGRSRQLVKDNGWRVFWTIIIAGTIALVFYLGFLAVAAAVAEGPIVLAVFSALASTVIAPFGALLVAVLYFRLLGLHNEPPPPAT